MSDPIKKVKGDIRPEVTLTLTDETSGAAIDLSAGTTTVQVFFRLQGSTDLLATLTSTKVGSGSTGQVKFKFDVAAARDAGAGNYEAEIEINFNGEKHTVFDVLKIKVRDQFA